MVNPMKEYLEKQADGSYKLMMRGVVKLDDDIEVPNGCNIITREYRMGSIVYFHWKSLDSDEFFLKMKKKDGIITLMKHYLISLKRMKRCRNYMATPHTSRRIAVRGFSKRPIRGDWSRFVSRPSKQHWQSVRRSMDVLKMWHSLLKTLWRYCQRFVLMDLMIFHIRTEWHCI